MTINKELLEIVSYLYKSTGLFDPFETTFRSIQVADHKEGPYYTDQTNIRLLAKLGALETIPQSQSGDYDYLFTNTGEFNLPSGQIPFFYIKTTRKQLVDAFLSYINDQIKETLSEPDQQLKVITAIFDKQLKTLEKKVTLELAMTSDDDFKDVHLSTVLEKLAGKKFIEILEVEINDQMVRFVIRTTDQLISAYKEYGRFIEPNRKGTTTYWLDFNTTQFGWDKVKGSFDSTESDPFKLLKILISSPSQPIPAKEIYTELWKELANKGDRGGELKQKLKDAKKHLKGRLGISGRDDNKPGNIKEKQECFTLYL